MNQPEPSGLFASMIQDVNVSAQAIEDFKEKVRLGKIKSYFRYTERPTLSDKEVETLVSRFDAKKWNEME